MLSQANMKSGFLAESKVMFGMTAVIFGHTSLTYSPTFSLLMKESDMFPNIMIIIGMEAP